MKRQIQDDALYNDRWEKEEKSELEERKSIAKSNYWYCLVFFCLCIIMWIITMLMYMIAFKWAVIENF